MTTVAKDCTCYPKNKQQKIRSRVILHRVFECFVLFFMLFLHIVEILISKFYVSGMAYFCLIFNYNSTSLI